MASQRFMEGTWEEAEAAVGTVIGTFEGPDEVNRADIRRRLEVLAWDCPLHYDDDVARSLGYEGVLAPATSHMALTIPSYWEPGEPRPAPGDPPLMPRIPMVFGLPGQGEHMIDTEVDVEYLKPIYAGDRLQGTSVLKSVTRKQTRVGDGAFMVVETTYTNQEEEVVAIDRFTLYRYEAKDRESADEESNA